MFWSRAPGDPRRHRRRRRRSRPPRRAVGLGRPVLRSLPRVCLQFGVPASRPGLADLILLVAWCGRGRSGCRRRLKGAVALRLRLRSHLRPGRLLAGWFGRVEPGLDLGAAALPRSVCAAAVGAALLLLLTGVGGVRPCAPETLSFSGAAVRGPASVAGTAPAQLRRLHP